MELFIIGLIAFFAGLVKGTSGFGSSLVTIPLLVYFYPYNEIVIMMITFNVFLNSLLLFENKGFSFLYLKDVWVIVLFGSIFTFVGINLLSNVDDNIIKYFAVFLIFFAVSNRLFKFRFKIKDNFLTQAVTGILSGIGNGTASIDGPPLVFYLTGIKANKAKFKNTLAAYFLFIGLLGIGILCINGSYNAEIIKNTVYIGLFLIFGVIIGMGISSKLNEDIFNKVIIVMLIILGFSMVI